MAGRRRLDVELARRGLVAGPEEAKRAIDAGLVRVNGAVADKSSRQVAASDAVVIVEPQKYVGRGAYKLESALDRFAIDPAGLRCLDVGASTGGFTDVLLQRHASHVVALDVGHGQIHERIAHDDRVTVLERTNMRHVEAGQLGVEFDLVVADVSFISLRALMKSIAAQLAGWGRLVALIKPQFEVSREEASRGRGVVSSPDLWRSAIDGVDAAAADQGLQLIGLVASPIRGGDGNVEFLAVFSAAGALAHPSDVLGSRSVDEVVAEALAVTPGDLR